MRVVPRAPASATRSRPLVLFRGPAADYHGTGEICSLFLL